LKNSFLFVYTPAIENIDYYTRIFLELINSKKNLGKIYIIECKGKSDLNKCVSNYRGERQKCLKCKAGISFVKNQFKEDDNIIFLSYQSYTFNFEIPISKNDLIDYKWKGINIGKGINSFLITVSKDHDYNFHKHHQIIKSQLSASILTLETLLYHNNNLKFNEIYLFNGRVSHYNVILEFARFYSISFKIFEMFSNNKFELSEDKALHDSNQYNSKVESNWLDSIETHSEKIKKSKLFFNKNKNSNENKKVDLKRYFKKHIPYIKISNVELITIFNSSRNEYECVENWNKNAFYEDDEDLIFETCQKFINDNSKFFILRVHPNLRYYENSQNRKINELKKLKNIHVIDGSVKMSSYQLLNISSKVITFGSTIGVESNFYQVPVICIGDSAYKYLNVCYNPISKSDLFKKINSKLNNKPLLGSYKYGYYMKEFGNNFKYQNSVKIQHGKLMYVLLSVFYKFKFVLLNSKQSLIRLKRLL